MLIAGLKMLRFVLFCAVDSLVGPRLFLFTGTTVHLDVPIFLSWAKFLIVHTLDCWDIHSCCLGIMIDDSRESFNPAFSFQFGASITLQIPGLKFKKELKFVRAMFSLVAIKRWNLVILHANQLVKFKGFLVLSHRFIVCQLHRIIYYADNFFDEINLEHSTLKLCLMPLRAFIETPTRFVLSRLEGSRDIHFNLIIIEENVLVWLIY
jgi:hypothetical protein